MIRVLRAADRVAVPWKNGGGITREVAMQPADAGIDDFDWRVSMAEVREAGPFSRFDGIDRTLMILEGRLRLTFSGRAVELGTDSSPFAFPGDVACNGQPLDGPVMDLNVMTRRDRTVAHVEHVNNASVQANSRHTLIVALGAFAVGTASGSTLLSRLDAILFDEGDIRVHGACILVRFRDAACP